jgi:SAM-dependent methyltransferase
MSGKVEWDKRYTSNEFVYGLEPNAFLKQELSKLKPGSLLLPGEGEGRNALWAAKNGWDVSAIDYSSVAQQKAQLLFSNSKVVVNYLIQDITELEIAQTFDVIALIFIHIPKEKQKVFAEKILQRLKTGGYLIMELFHPDQIPRNSGGPKNPDFFLTIEELKFIYRKLSVLELEKHEVLLDEGSLHQGDAAVIRMIAIKE